MSNETQDSPVLKIVWIMTNKKKSHTSEESIWENETSDLNQARF